MLGVTVSLTAPALQGTQSAVTDESGAMLGRGPAAGESPSSCAFAVRLERRGVGVGVGRATPLHQGLDPVLDPLRPGGESCRSKASAPLIDPHVHGPRR